MLLAKLSPPLPTLKLSTEKENIMAHCIQITEPAYKLELTEFERQYLLGVLQNPVHIENAREKTARTEIWNELKLPTKQAET